MLIRFYCGTYWQILEQRKKRKRVIGTRPGKLLSALWLDLNLKALFKLSFITGEPATWSPPGQQQTCVVCHSPVALWFRFDVLEDVKGVADPPVLPGLGQGLAFTPPCRARGWVVQLSRSGVPPFGAAAASPVTHGFSRRYKVKLGRVLPNPLLALRLWIPLAKNDCRRNSHVAVGRGNGCVWSISMLPTWGTRHWFMSQPQAKSLQQGRLLHVFEGGRGPVLANALILSEWLGGVEFFPLCIKKVSLLIF